MTLFSSQPGDEGLPGPARARVMAAIMTTTLMGVFDGTMINIALPSMAQEMQVPASIAVWFANGYLLAAAMTLAIFAALAARLGYRPVFLAGLTTFTLTSLGCALANKPEVLIGMRVLQGIGGAATLSIAPAILRSVFPGRLLGRILGFHALLIASSSAIGPVLGGTILHTLSWQWLFAINVLPAPSPYCWRSERCRGMRSVCRRPSTPWAPYCRRCCWVRRSWRRTAYRTLLLNSAAFAGWLSLR